MGTLIDAERMAPEHVRRHHLTEKVVAAMIHQAVGKPSVELEKLARRIGYTVAR
jgi:hypothetical protein